MDTKNKNFEIVQPTIRPISETEFALYLPYAFEWEKEGVRYRITVPRGYVFDGTTVPRAFWSIIDRVTGLGAAVVHDYLIECGGTPPQGTIESLQDEVWLDRSDISWERREIDKLFARILRAVGVPRLKRRAMYLAVRGYSKWKQGKMSVAKPRFYEFESDCPKLPIHRSIT